MLLQTLFFFGSADDGVICVDQPNVEEVVLEGSVANIIDVRLTENITSSCEAHNSLDATHDYTTCENECFEELCIAFFTNDMLMDNH